ncbi:hypothetical protein KBD71_02565 [Candidatus Woesebacteria bacterium]|nr:hypothetical protein [Candidatus Woesebacteria bacterium]
MASLKELFHAYATGSAPEEMLALFAKSNPLVVSVFISKLHEEKTDDDRRRNRLIAALNEMRLEISAIHTTLNAKRTRT